MQMEALDAEYQSVSSREDHDLFAAFMVKVFCLPGVKWGQFQEGVRW